MTLGSGTWHYLGGKVSGLVSVSAKNVLHVFGINPTKEIVQISQDPDSPSGWGSWNSLGASFSDFSISVSNEGRLEVFGIEDKTGQLLHRHQIASDPTGRSWSSYENLDAVVKAVSCVQGAQGNLHIFSIDQHDTLIQTHQTSKDEWSKPVALASDVVAFNSKLVKEIEILILTKGKYLYKLRAAPPPHYWGSWLFLADLGSIDTELG